MCVTLGNDGVLLPIDLVLAEKEKGKMIMGVGESNGKMEQTDQEENTKGSSFISSTTLSIHERT